MADRPEDLGSFRQTDIQRELQSEQLEKNLNPLQPHKVKALRTGWDTEKELPTFPNFQFVFSYSNIYELLMSQNQQETIESTFNLKVSGPGRLSQPGLDSREMENTYAVPRDSIDNNRKQVHRQLDKLIDCSIEKLIDLFEFLFCCIQLVVLHFQPCVLL